MCLFRGDFARKIELEHRVSLFSFFFCRSFLFCFSLVGARSLRAPTDTFSPRKSLVLTSNHEHRSYSVLSDRNEETSSLSSRRISSREKKEKKATTTTTTTTIVDARFSLSATRAKLFFFLEKYIAWPPCFFRTPPAPSRPYLRRERGEDAEDQSTAQHGFVL